MKSELTNENNLALLGLMTLARQQYLELETTCRVTARILQDWTAESADEAKVIADDMSNTVSDAVYGHEAGKPATDRVNEILERIRHLASV